MSDLDALVREIEDLIAAYTREQDKTGRAHTLTLIEQKSRVFEAKLQRSSPEEARAVQGSLGDIIAELDKLVEQTASGSEE